MSGFDEHVKNNIYKKGSILTVLRQECVLICFANYRSATIVIEDSADSKLEDEIPRIVDIIEKQCV